MHTQLYHNTFMLTRKPLLAIICLIQRRRILILKNTYYNNIHFGFYGNKLSQSQKQCFSCKTTMSKRKLQPDRHNIAKKRILETEIVGRSTMTGEGILGRCISSRTEHKCTCRCLVQDPFKPGRDRWMFSQPDLLYPKPVITRSASHKPQENMDKEKDIETEGNLITCVQDVLGDGDFEGAEDVDVVIENNVNNMHASQLAQCGKNVEVLYCQHSDVDQSDRSDTTPPDPSDASLSGPQCQQSAISETTNMGTCKKTKPTVLPKHVLEKVEQFVSKKCDSDISWIHDVVMPPSNISCMDSEAEDASLFGNLFSEQQENVKKTDQSMNDKKSSAVESHEESGEIAKGMGDRGVAWKSPPNYFVAVQITNPQIHSGLSQVQQEVMCVNHKMKEVMIKLPTLHITLMVMNLQTEDDIARASAALTESGCELRERFKTLPVLEVAGLGTFRNQVVFATVSPGDALDDLTHVHQCVIDKMADHGVVSTETKGLTPHITIMKMSKVKAAFRRSVAKKIDPSLYSKFKEMTFGKETVQRLQLCAMLKPKDKSGYYNVAHEVYLGQGEVTVSEFSRCLVQSSIVSALEKVKLDSVALQTQVHSQNSTGKPEHKPQKKKQKCKKSKEVKKNSGNGCTVLTSGKANSSVK